MGLSNLAYSFFVRTAVRVCYQLHLMSLNQAAPLPDFSAFLNDTKSFKVLTAMGCVGLGWLGLSTQIWLTVDLVYISSYPFRGFLKMCNFGHHHLLYVKHAVIDILTIKRKYWVTCPYPEYFLADPYKIVYVCTLPLIFVLLALTRIYSILMSFLIILSEIVMAMGQNIALRVQELGRAACVIAGVQIENDRICFKQSTFSERFRCFKSRLSGLQWMPVLDWGKVTAVLTGWEQQATMSSSCQKIVKRVSIIRVYQNFMSYFK